MFSKDSYRQLIVKVDLSAGDNLNCDIKNDDVLGAYFQCVLSEPRKYICSYNYILNLFMYIIQLIHKIFDIYKVNDENATTTYILFNILIIDNTFNVFQHCGFNT